MSQIWDIHREIVKYSVLDLGHEVCSQISAKKKSEQKQQKIERERDLRVCFGEDEIDEEARVR